MRVPGKATFAARRSAEIVRSRSVSPDGERRRGPLDAAVDDAESAAPDLLDIVESIPSSSAGISGTVPPRRVRINVGHRRSLHPRPMGITTSFIAGDPTLSLPRRRGLDNHLPHVCPFLQTNEGSD